MAGAWRGSCTAALGKDCVPPSGKGAEQHADTIGYDIVEFWYPAGHPDLRQLQGERQQQARPSSRASVPLARTGLRVSTCRAATSPYGDKQQQVADQIAAAHAQRGHAEQSGSFRQPMVVGRSGTGRGAVADHYGNQQQDGAHGRPVGLQPAQARIAARSVSSFFGKAKRTTR